MSAKIFDYSRLLRKLAEAEGEVPGVRLWPCKFKSASNFQGDTFVVVLFVLCLGVEFYVRFHALVRFG